MPVSWTATALAHESPSRAVPPGAPSRLFGRFIMGTLVHGTRPRPALCACGQGSPPIRARHPVLQCTAAMQE